MGIGKGGSRKLLLKVFAGWIPANEQGSNQPNDWTNNQNQQCGGQA